MIPDLSGIVTSALTSKFSKHFTDLKHFHFNFRGKSFDNKGSSVKDDRKYEKDKSKSSGSSSRSGSSSSSSKHKPSPAKVHIRKLFISLTIFFILHFSLIAEDLVVLRC